MSRSEEDEEIKGKQQDKEKEGHNLVSSEATWTQYAASFKLIYSPQQQGEGPPMVLIMGQHASLMLLYFFTSPSHRIDEVACNLHAALSLLSFLKPNEVA